MPLDVSSIRDGAALTLDDLTLAGREHVLDEVREHEPVTWMPALGWLARHEPRRRARGAETPPPL